VSQINSPVETPQIKDPLNHAPDKAGVALLLVDVINALEFDGAEKLHQHAMPMAHALAALKARCKQAGIPAIYANDNFGRWRSDFPRLVEYCLQPDRLGHNMVQLLKPGDDDYFILKPRHSAFFQTNLDILLKYLGVHTVIVTGVAGDMCVLFTANDAYIRDFRVVAPADCMASEDKENNRQVSRLMQRVLKADITPSTELDLEALAVPASA
jgi:nicotinamidase-related amidase